MVGTIFVNFMANILNTIESTIRIDIKNAKLNKKFAIGGLYSCMPRHSGFFLNKIDFRNTKIISYLGQQKINKIKKIDFTEKNGEIMNQYFRCRLINLLEEIILSKNINKGKKLKKSQRLIPRNKKLREQNKIYEKFINRFYS